MEHTKSQAAFEEARQYIPGGVNSPVRSFRSVGGVPPFISGGKGSKIYDIDGNEYIDYVMSYGPLLMGHVPDCVTDAIKDAAEKGTSYGAPTVAETELAKLVCRLVPSMDMVRMVNSGTEATMSALRLARAYTGRDCIIKFIGCYHGHHDSLLVKAGSGGATFGVPDSPGVPKAVAATTITVQRPACSGKGFCRTRRRNRLRYYGTDSGQHGPCTSARRLPGRRTCHH